jgi:hypothetical protein
MSTSAMRRNVAEHLGIATANEIKEGLYRVSADEAGRVRAWLDRCEIAWRKCPTEAAAVALEGTQPYSTSNLPRRRRRSLSIARSSMKPARFLGTLPM